MKNKGFSMVELIVVIAIMVVLLAVLSPSLLRYVESSRMQKDESAMDEVCNAVQLALADSNNFDEMFSYSIPNNYVTYTDSSGVYGAKYTDEEFWAPDGSGHAVTITFNPDEKGTYYLAKGAVNDMTFGNGSVADSRTNANVQQCFFEEVGQGKFYAALKKTIGETFTEKSATYKNSSYTVFIKYNLIDGIYKPEVYGSFNGTNLSESCPAALGSGTESYTPEGEAVTTITGGTTTPNFSSSDLSGGGSVSGSSGWNNSLGSPRLKGGGTFNQATDTEPLVFTRTGRTDPIIGIKVNGTLLQSTDYTLEDNSKTIKLSVNYLMGLNLGNFSLSVVTAENTVSASFTVKYLPKNTETVIYEENNLDKNITYYNFYIDKSNLEKIGYTGTEGEKLIVPAAFKDLESGKWHKVVGINQYSFSNCTNLEAIFLPNTIKQIRTGTFSGCTNLKYVKLSENIALIEDNAFNNCQSLESIIIPDSVTSIQGSAFADCKRMKSVKLSNSMTTIAGYTFIGCESLESLTIPSSITSIKARSFEGCINLTTVNFPNKPTEIGYNAFRRCGLREVVIPNSVITIGNHAFADNKELTNIKFPNSIDMIDTGVIGACPKLTTVIVPESVKEVKGYAFNSCSALTTLSIPNSVISIGEWAIKKCKNLKDIYYQGTIEEWNNIIKGSFWNHDTSNYIIHCTNGDVSKS